MVYPLGQVLQEVCPVVALYVLPLHTAQSPTTLPPGWLRAVPTGQLVWFVPPVQYLPAGHASHDVFAVVVLYVPGAQGVQLVAAAVAAVLAVPAPHGVHIAYTVTDAPLVEFRFFTVNEPLVAVLLVDHPTNTYPSR